MPNKATAAPVPLPVQAIEAPAAAQAQAAVETPAVVPPAMAPEAAPVAAAPVAVPPAATSTVGGDYFVAVGVFSSRQRSDELVASLTQAGLPAIQRPFHLGQRAVQQIVLGPFFSHSDATTDLERLKALGGYNDARIISSQ